MSNVFKPKVVLVLFIGTIIFLSGCIDTKTFTFKCTNTEGTKDFEVEITSFKQFDYIYIAELKITNISNLTITPDFTFGDNDMRNKKFGYRNLLKDEIMSYIDRVVYGTSKNISENANRPYTSYTYGKGSINPNAGEQLGRGLAQMSAEGDIQEYLKVKKNILLNYLPETIGPNETAEGVLCFQLPNVPLTYPLALRIRTNNYFYDFSLE